VINVLAGISSPRMQKGKVRRDGDKSYAKSIEIGIYRELKLSVILKSHFIMSQQIHISAISFKVVSHDLRLIQ
jgi:hypothetical protein